jgi:hypothetical protein
MVARSCAINLAASPPPPALLLLHSMQTHQDDDSCIKGTAGVLHSADLTLFLLPSSPPCSSGEGGNARRMATADVAAAAGASLRGVLMFACVLTTMKRSYLFQMKLHSLPESSTGTLCHRTCDDGWSSAAGVCPLRRVMSVNDDSRAGKSSSSTSTTSK